MFCPPRGGVRHELHLLLPLALHHHRLPLAVIAVVVGSGEGCSDCLLLMPPE